MGIKGIDHWVIVSGDLERTLEFYQRLGFTMAREHRAGRPDISTIRINDAQKINVHGRDWPERAGYHGARQPTVGGADFCLEWEGTVQQVSDLLTSNGIVPEVGPRPRMCARGLSTSMYFRDPDGNLVGQIAPVRHLRACRAPDTELLHARAGGRMTVVNVSGRGDELTDGTGGCRRSSSTGEEAPVPPNRRRARGRKL